MNYYIIKLKILLSEEVSLFIEDCLDYLDGISWEEELNVKEFRKFQEIIKRDYSGICLGEIFKPTFAFIGKTNIGLSEEKLDIDGALYMSSEYLEKILKKVLNELDIVIINSKKSFHEDILLDSILGREYIKSYYVDEVQDYVELKEVEILINF